MGNNQEGYSIWIKSGFVIYAILCLCIFTYLRFPYDVISSRIETSLSEYLGMDISVDSIRTALPIGFSFKSVEVNKNLMFNEITLRPGLLSLIRGKLNLDVKALLGQGRIDGFFKTPINSFGEPVTIGGKIDNMDISPLIKTFWGLDNINGHVTGTLEFEGLPRRLYKSDGQVCLIFKDGTFPVFIPMLPLDAISFNTLDIDAHMKKGLLIVDKASIEGSNLSGTLKGRVRLNKQITYSRLNLTGEMKLPDSIINILPEDSQLKKGRIKFTLGGRLNLPKFRLITR
ncbi:MAG: type II secretion system protein GspN [Deltaproteobacteria bacterium]|nr:type II secretion system protein GspN [Deltaproteobacteria bacterium]